MHKSLLFVGQCYYNNFFLSQALRERDWHVESLSIDPNPESQKYYWSQDPLLPQDKDARIEFFLNSLLKFQIFHFANRGGISFITSYSNEDLTPSEIAKYIFLLPLWFSFRIVFRYNIKLFLNLLSFMGLGKIELNKFTVSYRHKKIHRITHVFYDFLPRHWDLMILKALGKKIVYTNNGCHDGVTPKTFSTWGPHNVCSICAWNGTKVCTNSDAERWGKFRNFMSDFQILSGGNRADYNLNSSIHEVPEFYCLDKELWKPNLEIPEKYKLNFPKDVVKIYHSVGNYNARTKDGVNIKCSHIYFPLIEELKREGYKVELVFCEGIPIKDVRFIMGQCDIIADMLTFGWFGANVREGLMLGIPTICFLRPEWLASANREKPDYVKELPIINASPENIKKYLIELICNEALRKEVGRKSRKFAIKWHSKEVGGEIMDQIYTNLMS